MRSSRETSLPPRARTSCAACASSFSATSASSDAASCESARPVGTAGANPAASASEVAAPSQTENAAASASTFTADTVAGDNEKTLRTTAYIGLGSNLGRSRETIERAVAAARWARLDRRHRDLLASRDGARRLRRPATLPERRGATRDRAVGAGVARRAPRSRARAGPSSRRPAVRAANDRPRPAPLRRIAHRGAGLDGPAPSVARATVRTRAAPRARPGARRPRARPRGRAALGARLTA